jgi:hypothetical protein
LRVRLKKTLHLLLIVSAGVLAVIVLLSVLLFHRPSYYKPLDFAHSKEVSLYLTHDLLPALYNGAQYQEPFNLVVTQSGINDIVARFDWPKEFGGIRVSAPMVFFAPGSIVLMGTMFLNGTEFVVTVIVEPTLDAEGLLNLQVVGVKIGAVDITPLTGVLAKRIYRQQSLTAADVDTEDFWARATASLLNGEPFKPVFKLEDKKVRVEKVMIEQKKLTIRFVPVFD